MKINVQVRTSGGTMFGGEGETVNVKIDADERVLVGDHLRDALAAGTVAANTILAAISDPGSPDGDDDAVGTTSDGDKSEPRADDGAEPGDAVRLTWPEGSSRLAIRTEFGYEAPALPSRSFPDALEITDDTAALSGVRVEVVAPLGETQGA